MKPLVEPGPPLTAEQAETYARHLLLPQLGEEAQRRLLAARVCVVGAGGLGSPVLLYLAAAGVGTLGVIDDDVVDRTNLQRQVLHGVADVGRSKLESAFERVREISPAVRLVPHAERITPANAVDILRGYDLVLDGTDTFETRYAVSDACAELGIPLVWGSVLGFDAQISVFWQRADGGTTLRDLFPTPPPAGSVPSCSDAGVLGSLTGQVGSTMATEAIKLITGVGEPLLGRVLVLDSLNQRWTEVPLRAADRPAPAAQAQPTQAQPTRAAPAPAQPSQPARSLTTPELTPTVPVIDVAALHQMLSDGQPVTVLDVREPAEVAAGGIPGALHIPLRQLLTELGRADVPRGGTVVAYCAIGPRSERAAALLRAEGVEAVSLEGGYPAWVASTARSA